jgi:cysteine desulfurase/selenocysteine lyase
MLGDRTRLVGITLVSNTLGTVNPMAEIVAAAHAKGALVLVDAAQAVPCIPVDVQALGCDFLAFSGHKLFGPTGIGVLYARNELLAAMPPFLGGGDMILSVSFERTTYNVPPFKFEAGTPNVAGAIGLGRAIEFVRGLGWDWIQAHEQELLRKATAALGKLDGVRLVGTAAKKVATLSFTMEGVHPHDIGTILDSQGVAVRAGHHCTQPLMARFGVPATARASFSVYNTPEDVDRLVAALRNVSEVML